MAAGAVTLRLNLAAGGYSAEMVKAERQMRQLQKAGEEFGHSMPSQMQAASASLRVLQGGITNNLRAAERFLSILPGVGAALQAAFPVVGAIALVGVLIKAGEEISKVVSKFREMPPDPFKEVVASARLSNDALAITNDRLANEIAKLEKKPQNRMAEALDQMREASDKLNESLEKSNRAFDEAASKGQVGRITGLVKNVTPTDRADAAIKQARAGVQAVRDDHETTIQDALDSGDPKNIKQAREALMVDLQKAYATQDAALRAGLDKAQAAAKDFHGSYSVGSDPRAVIQRYQGALQVSAQDQQSVGAQYGNSLLTGRIGKDQDANDANALANEAARKRLQAMEDEQKQLKAQYGMSIAAERSYWQSRESAFTAGSESYRTVVNKVADLELQMARQESESLKAARGRSATDSRESSRALESSSAAVSALMKTEGEDVLHTGERWAAYNREVAKAAEIEAANAAAFDKTRIALELAGGQISQLDAAQQMAAVHAKEFAHDLATLQDQRKQIENDSDLSDVQRQTALKGNANAQSELNGRYATVQMGDNGAIADQQLGPATQKALGTMVNDWSNMTKGIVETMTKAIDSFNDDITKAITGHGSKADFGKTLSQAGEGLIKTGLQKAESGVMGAFGLGKPDGTSTNPIYTRSADIGGIFGGGSSGQQDSSGQNGQGKSGFWGQLGSSLLKSFLKPKSDGSGGSDDGGDDDGGGLDFDYGFQGGYAKGGNYVANRPMLIGEKGPEIMVPRHAGTVIPNHQIGNLGGGGGDTHIHIDARGSNDPAAVHAAIMRAAPHIAANAMQAQHSMAKRMPHGR